MSWDIDLVNKDGEMVQVPSFQEGGTYLITDEPLQDASLNITWNYSQYYYHLIDTEKGIKWLHEKQAKDTIRILEFAVDMLGTDQDEDYWKTTKGNAGYALAILLKWANMHEEAYWRVA